MKKGKNYYLLPLIVLSLVVMAFPCNANTLVGPEMLNNNSFENWTDFDLDSWYWFPESGNTSDIVLEKETNLFQDGSCSLKITLTALNTTPRYLVQNVTAARDIPLYNSLQIYDNDSSGIIIARLDYLDINGDKLTGMESYMSLDENEWRDPLGGVSTSLMDGTTHLRFMIGFTSDTDSRNVTLYIDNASLKDNSIPELSNISNIFFLSTITLVATIIFRKFKK